MFFHNIPYPLVVETYELIDTATGYLACEQHQDTVDEATLTDQEAEQRNKNLRGSESTYRWVPKSDRSNDVL